MYMKAPAAVLIVAAFLLQLLAGCGGKAAKPLSVAGSAKVTDPSQELPLPMIPASISDPQERAAYLALHYWDALDFANTRVSLDSAFMEQAFANYSTVLPLTPDSARRAAVYAVLDSARTASPRVYENFLEIAEHYLYEPESPVYNESSYLPFAEYILQLSGGRDERAADVIADIRRNAPGTHAPYFQFRRFPSGTARLLASDAGEAITMLMFYEPDCDRCHTAIELLSGSEALANQVANGALRVVAVYVGDDTAQWRTHAATLPSDWLVGIAPASGAEASSGASSTSGVSFGGAEASPDDLYSIRATPSIYLIDANGTIILKDAPLQEVASALGL